MQIKSETLLLSHWSMSNCPPSKFTIILSSIRLLTGWLFPLNHQLLSFLKEKVLKGDAGDVILQVSFQYFTIMMVTIEAMGAPSASSLGEKTKSTILGVVVFISHRQMALGVGMEY